MTEFERLMICGFSAEVAESILEMHPDPNDRAQYIRMIELIFDDRHEYV